MKKDAPPEKRNRKNSKKRGEGGVSKRKKPEISSCWEENRELVVVLWGAASKPDPRMFLLKEKRFLKEGRETPICFHRIKFGHKWAACHPFGGGWAVSLLGEGRNGHGKERNVIRARHCPIRF